MITDEQADGLDDGNLAGWLAGWLDGWMDGWMDGIAHLSKYSTVPCTSDDDLGDHRIINGTVGKIIDAFRLLMTFIRP